MQPIVGHFRHLDLFSGIGGFALAAEAAGWDTVGFAEVDDYASRVLKRHWPDVPNYGDVRNVPAMPVDLVTGGFPCQPFNTAGKRKGTADNRYLWPEMLAVVRRCRPAWVLCENVFGFRRMGLADCLANLEGEGYGTWAGVIPAASVGAPHERKRVWVAAYRDDGKPHVTESQDRTGDQWTFEGWAELWSGRHPLKAANARNSRVDDGIPGGMDRLRIKALGNAIVPQVAYPLLRWMREGLCMANIKIIIFIISFLFVSGCIVVPFGGPYRRHPVRPIHPMHLIHPMYPMHFTHPIYPIDPIYSINPSHPTHPIYPTRPIIRK